MSVERAFDLGTKQCGGPVSDALWIEGQGGTGLCDLDGNQGCFRSYSWLAGQMLGAADRRAHLFALVELSAQHDLGLVDQLWRMSMRYFVLVCLGDHRESLGVLAP